MLIRSITLWCPYSWNFLFCCAGWYTHQFNTLKPEESMQNLQWLSGFPFSVCAGGMTIPLTRRKRLHADVVPVLDLDTDVCGTLNDLISLNYISQTLRAVCSTVELLWSLFSFNMNKAEPDISRNQSLVRTTEWIWIHHLCVLK